MVKNVKKIGLAFVAIVLTLCVGILPAFAQPEYPNSDAPPFSEIIGDSLDSLILSDVFPNRLNADSIQSYANAASEAVEWYSSYGDVFTYYTSSGSVTTYHYYQITEWTPFVIYELDLSMFAMLDPSIPAMSGYCYIVILTPGKITARNWTNTTFAADELAPGVYTTTLTWNESVPSVQFGGHGIENGGAFTVDRVAYAGENPNVRTTTAFGRVVYNYNDSFGSTGLISDNIDSDGITGFVGLYDKWHNASLAFDGQLTGGGGASEEELESAYSDGYSAGYTAGDSNGYGRGYDDGYEDGEEYGFRTGYSQGHDEGYDQGYDQGYKDINQGAYDEGYGAGFGAGQGVGYSTGYTAGYASGEEVGYTNGYRAGYSETPVDLDVDSAINSFFSGVHSIFNGWFGVEIFGISVAGTLIGILIVCIVAFVIKKLV